MRALRVPIMMGLIFMLLWLVGGGVSAQTKPKKYPPVTPSVLPSILTPAPSPSVPPEDVTTPPSVEPSRQPREPLPFTGADLTLFVVIAGGLAIGGTVLVRVARRGRAGS